PPWAQTGFSRFREACYSAHASGAQAIVPEGVEWITGCETGELSVGAGRTPEGWVLARVDRASRSVRWRQRIDLKASEGKYPTVAYLELAGNLLLAAERCGPGTCLVARDLLTGEARWSAPAPRELSRSQPLATAGALVLEVTTKSHTALEIR